MVWTEAMVCHPKIVTPNSPLIEPIFSEVFYTLPPKTRSQGYQICKRVADLQLLRVHGREHWVESLL